ncbi:DEAD/DEAH box helicase [Rhodococcus qingshengii]|uniref:DEAD/DEAH box helicase n=1 Tax=Rhodococcus qingshengii TaxID=334542 RepID=UPI001C8CC370|nr:DEAD/DEAH box helicase [Rhodococcus qingshengii]MBX9151987.1 DEAD/DEAH box helicase [Rhodococcus qingshengii]
MEQSLDLNLLRGALDETANLPTAEQLRQQLADAEVDAFFAGTEPLDPVLLETAWNLHHVGTVRPALQIYGAERQVQANAVAAHIFDLELRNNSLPIGDRLVMTFAAQVSYVRGDRSPNATALARRLPKPSARLAREPGRASLELGCTFLSLGRADTMSLLRNLIEQREVLEATTTAEPTSGAGVFAAAFGVIEGCTRLQRYLRDGSAEDREAARSLFGQAANVESARRDLDSRWVAAHLLDLCDDLGSSSVWANLPPDVPPAAGRSMTLGEPPVMTLWPPQVALLSDRAQSPLQSDVKRAVLTFPTSAGKTLLTQLAIAHHLAIENTGVCVVAPSHSLCREIREGLDRRLWVLRKTIAEDGPLGDPQRVNASVVVMTPERLSARLRADESGLLEQFGLFVLDEAHLVADKSRGWTFETTISRLHEITTDTSHRLVLVSAAMGGTASIQTWLNCAIAPKTVVASWRGPRRLHATYTPMKKPGTRRTVPPTGNQRKPRIETELVGEVRLYVDQGEAVATRQHPLGIVKKIGSSPEIKPSKADQLLPMVKLAAESGSVLTVHATKKNAETLASRLAHDRPEKAGTAPLVHLASMRLGQNHPLVSILRCGVAYHHAALPVDVQIEIENAVRSGVIDIICATTTLTEGVNLPVRTVIVCERGYYSDKKFHLYIGSAELLNAAGRAGRAGRETEGWIIVADQTMGPDPREALLGIDRDQDIKSTLSTPDALAALDEYEHLTVESAGIVLSNVPPTVDGLA